MTIESVFETGLYMESRALRRIMSGFTQSAVAVLDRAQLNLQLSTWPSLASFTKTRQIDARMLDHQAQPGVIEHVLPVELSAQDLYQLNSAHQEPAQIEDWFAFNCCFDSGIQDRVALRLGQDQNPALVGRLLEKLWPVLREDCLTETCGPSEKAGDDAMLWMISNKIDVAVLVLDRHSLMLRINVAARNLLEEATVLRRGKGGVFAATDGESRLFRHAVAECADCSDPEAAENILFLTGPTGQKVPVTLSRFFHQGMPTELVMAMLPTPPDPGRVEMLGRKLGLTASEARVAALMQTGMSNREAAPLAGLKEQTFNTYSKRVLNKLNVSGRAEMAQLLTWQAAGRSTV